MDDKSVAAVRHLIIRQERDLWTIGDRIAAMQDAYRERTGRKLTDKAVAKVLATNWTAQRIGQVVKTARFYPPDHRIANASHWTHDQARQINAKLPEARRKSSKQIAAALTAGHTSSRAITRWLNQEAEKDLARTMQAVSPRWHTQTLVNRPHHALWEDVVEQLPADCLAAIWADPPFGRFARDSLRKHPAVTGCAILSEADNAAWEEARRTTFALFERLPAKLRRKAVLFLHQYGGIVDDPELINFAAARGWQSQCPLIWMPQATPSPSRMGEAFGSVCQRILVFTHGSATLERVGTLPNGNVILDIPGTSRAAARRVARGDGERGDHHVFEHPPDLPERVLRNVLPQDSRALVFEPFGCTGPASIAAIRNGWDWVYCESRAENFALGERRILDALEAQEGSDRDAA